MTQVQWLLVGAGDIARKRVAAALATTSNSTLVAVCSKEIANAQALARQFGAAKTFDNLTDALADSGANAVYLATPVWLHVPQAVEALEAGKHVLLEKPLGLDASEGKNIIAAAEKNMRFAGCAYYRRLDRRYEYTKKVLAETELGQPVAVRMTYLTWYNPDLKEPKSWRVIKGKSGGGVLMDMGCHMFDVVVGLFGLPVSVYAKCINLVQGWEVEDSASVVMTLKNGALAEARFNWNTKSWQHEFEIVGSEGRITWSPYDTGPVIKVLGDRVEHVEIARIANVHGPLVEDFVQSILTNKMPCCSASEALKTNVLLDSVYESARNGCEVKLS